MHSYKLTTLITLAKQTLVKELHVGCQKKKKKSKSKSNKQTNKRHQPQNIKSFQTKQASDYLGFHNYIFLLKKLYFSFKEKYQPIVNALFLKAFK